MIRLIAASIALLLAVGWPIAGAGPGASAATPINVSGSPGASENPTVAAAGDLVLVVWEEGDALWSAVRAAGTWRPAGPVPAAFGSSPRIAAAADGTFDLVWSSYNDLGNNFDILHARYEDELWSLPAMVAETPGDSLAPDIGVAEDGGRLVVWIEVDAGARTLLAASADAEGDWSYGPLDDAAADALDLARGPGDWHLVWAEDIDGDGSSDALFRSSEADGWAIPEVVYMGGTSVSDPSLAFDGNGRPMTAWLAGGSAVRHSRRVGDRWTDPAAVDGGQGASGRAVVALDGGVPVIAWSRGADVLVSREISGEWGPPATAMHLGARARGVSMAESGSRPVLVAEGRDDQGNSDVYFTELAAEPPTTATAPSPTATQDATPGTATQTPTMPVTPSGSPTAIETAPAPARVLLLPIARKAGN